MDRLAYLDRGCADTGRSDRDAVDDGDDNEEGDGELRKVDVVADDDGDICSFVS